MRNPTVNVGTKVLENGDPRYSYELRMLRSGLDVWKNGSVDVSRLRTSTLPHIHTHKRPKAD